MNVKILLHVRGAWPAMPYTRLYSVHPYWWKRQVSHQLWPSGSQHTSKKECRRDIHSGFETHEEGHTKSKTGAISGSTKWTLVQRKNFLKKKPFKLNFFSFSICFLTLINSRLNEAWLYNISVWQSKTDKAHRLAIVFF